jgi:hypothetical protein
MRRRLLGLSLLVWVCAAAQALAQQGTAQLSGKITDAQGGAIPGVNIVITNEDSGVVRDTVSTSDGSYFAAQMVPGRYRIQATLEGFKALDRRNVVLIVGQTAAVDLVMEVGGLAETLTVTGDAPLVDVTTATVGGHISADELNELPSGNRNYMAFVGNVPGTIFVPSAEFLNDTFQANGQSAAANNIVFDGAGNTDEQRGSNVGGQTRAANESIQEVQIITNQFDAEWGRASGAVVNAVTKSGTNQFTGSAFSFFTGKGVTATDFFTKVNGQEKPDVGKTEWGGTVGGPIIRNKLHFFVSLERLELQRNWSSTFPTRPSLNLSEAGEESAWNTLWRIDHQVSPKHTWAFRWLREVAPQFNRFDGNTETKDSYNDETDLDQTLVATLTSVVSDTKVNTFRAAGTLEDTVHSNPAWRALKAEYARCVPCPENAGQDQILVKPTLTYDSFNVQSATTMDYSLQKSWQFSNTFSWFIPEAKGRHDLKFGAQYTRTWLSNPNWANINGSFNFDHDLEFDVNNPRTYPNRLSIRVPGALTYDLWMHVYELFAQDKWQPKPGLTVSFGVRYDLERMPYNIDPANPYFSDKSQYPVDKGNVSPRIGLVWNPDGQGRSVIRGGFGRFYDRTQLGTIDNFFTDHKYAASFTAQYPQNNLDPGPGSGQFPAEPVLQLFRPGDMPAAVRAIVNRDYPPGSTTRNTGTLTWDSPDRQQPYFDQLTVGYEREVLTGLSVSADYVRMRGDDLFFNPDLNIGNRTTTARTAPVIRGTDPYGVLNATLRPGEPNYTSQTIRLLTTAYGYSNYDALNVSVEKRYSNNYSLRGGYSRGYTRGISGGQGDTPQFQKNAELNSEKSWGRNSVDRQHVFTMSGRMEIPKARGVTLSGTMRAMTGAAFTLQDDTFDVDQNGILNEPLPAGTYSTAAEHGMRDVEVNGDLRNGSYGPGFFQLDLRLGYRARLGGRRTLDIFGEAFNVTDRANFNNPGSNRRVATDFLRFTGLVGGTGFPRQLQLGVRLGF